LKRRLLLEIETVDAIPGSTLEVIIQIAGLLDKMKKEDRILDYGIALEHDFTWFVKTCVEMDRDLEKKGL